LVLLSNQSSSIERLTKRPIGILENASNTNSFLKYLNEFYEKAMLFSDTNNKE